MKTIIVPLDKTLLDFEKHDGSTFAERFIFINKKPTHDYTTK